MKVCYSCKIEKPLEDFAKDNIRKSTQRECKACGKERKSLWNRTIAGVESAANTKLKQRFGISLKEYDSMAQAVNNVCEMCSKPNGIKRLAVDHSHKTGKIRGLLCSPCNLVLGNALDDISVLEAAIKYLKERN